MSKPLVNKPADTDFVQQRFKTRPASVSSLYIAIAIIVLAIIFIPVGTKLTNSNKKVWESKITYDEHVYTDCSISESNEGKECQLTFHVTDTFEGPLYVYYEMTNFFQNHRRYYQSRSIFQLRGENLESSDVELDCNPLYKNGSLLLNPCGLIANSFFTDIIALDSNASIPSGLNMDEDGISLKSDRNDVFHQVHGFQYVEVTNTNVTCSSVNLPDGCKSYTNKKTKKSYLFWYPDDDTVQYLYESYPDQISPIDGVTDEHFIVWMKTASLPTFRKLYGRIEGNFNEGDVIVFNITANYEVDSYEATKKLVLSTLGSGGGRNMFLGVAYKTIGSLCMVFGFVLLLRVFWNDITDYYDATYKQR